MAAAPNIGFSFHPKNRIPHSGCKWNPDYIVKECPEQIFMDILRAARLRRIAAGTSLKRLFIRTTSAASIATSVPAPMAIPISALVRAGASLIPSPTMAHLAFLLQLSDHGSLPSGRTPAITSSTPACASDGLCCPLIVTGQHDDTDSHILKLLHRLRAVLLDNISHCDDPRKGPDLPQTEEAFFPLRQAPLPGSSSVQEQLPDCLQR